MYVVARIDPEKCNGCKLCIQICPEPNTIAFLPDEKKAQVVIEKCKGCGLCVIKCPKGYIALVEIALEETG